MLFYRLKKKPYLKLNLHFRFLPKFWRYERGRLIHEYLHMCLLAVQYEDHQLAVAPCDDAPDMSWSFDFTGNRTLES